MKVVSRREAVRTAAVIVLVCVAVAGVFVHQVNRGLVAQFEYDCLAVARSFAAASVDDLARLDVAAVRQRIGDLREVGTVDEALVLDAGETVLTDGTIENLQRDQKTANPVLAEAVATGSWASRTEGAKLRVAGPINGPEGDVAGYVSLGFVRDRPDAIAWRATVNGSLAALACVVLGVIVVLVLPGASGAAASDASTGAAGREAGGATGPGARPGEIVERVLELAADAAALIDRRGDVVLVNGQLLALAGRRREDLVGRPFWRLLAAESMSQAAFDDLLRRAAGGGVDAVLGGGGHGGETAVRLLARTLGGQGDSVRRVVLVIRRDGASPLLGATSREAERIETLERELEAQRAGLEQERALLQEERRAHEETRRKQGAAAAAGAGQEQARKNELWAWAEEELKRVQARLQQSQQKIQQVEEELSSTIAARDLAERHKSRLEGDVERLQEEVQHLQGEIARRPAEILGDAARRAEGERRRLVEELHHARQERDRIAQEAKDSEVARRQLVEELRVAQDAQKRSAHLFQQAEQGRQAVETRLRELEADRERLAAEVRSLGAGVARPPAPAPAAEPPAAEARRSAATGAGEAVIAAMKEVPEGVIDRQVALAGVDGDVEFLCALIGIFLENCPRQLGEIKSAISREDGETVERTARMLRGTVGNFGARDAGRAAQRLEEAATARDFASLADACAALEMEIERLKPALGVLRQESV